MYSPFFYGPTASRACNLCLIPPVESGSPPKIIGWLSVVTISTYQYNKFDLICIGLNFSPMQKPLLYIRWNFTP